MDQFENDINFNLKSDYVWKTLVNSQTQMFSIFWEQIQIKLGKFKSMIMS